MDSGDDNTPSANKVDLKIDNPAVYRIRVVGFLDNKWSTRLGGVDIDSSGKEDKVIITTLSGPMIDQAALFGVLNALYNMRLPLLSVECLEIT